MKKLIIIGANNFQLPLIKKARDMKLETHVFAWEDGAVGKIYADYFYPISIVNKEEILKAAKKIKPDGIISIASDLATITVNYLANKLKLTGNSNETTKKCTDKYLMRRELEKNKIRCPKFSKTQNTDKICNYFGKFPLIVKPTDRSGSRGVTKVDNKKELQKAIKRASNESFQKSVITEEFIDGKEYSVEYISFKGNHYFLQVTEKETTGRPYYVEKGHHQPGIQNKKLIEKIKIITEKTLDSLGILNGASHTEIIINEDEDIFIVEAGARMGGDYIGSHLVELSTGYDFLKAVIEISLGTFKFRKPRLKKNSGVYFAIPKPGKVLDVKNYSYKYKEIIESKIFVKKDDNIPIVKESNERAGYYIYQNDNTKFKTQRQVIKIKTSANKDSI